MKPKRRFTILMADDDLDDRMLLKSSLEEEGIPGTMLFVEDGKELLDYLLRRGLYTDPKRAPSPDLILLDLNMPRKDGREALKEIKAAPKLRSIPVVVFTTSHEQRDIALTYETGASSFITKPLHLPGWGRMARTIRDYWFKTVELPPCGVE